MQLKGYQRKFLRSLAHDLNPSAFIGKNDLSDGVYSSIEDAFKNNELIKIKILNKDNLDSLVNSIERNCCCNIVGSIGKILIAYKKNIDPEKRKISLPCK